MLLNSKALLGPIDLISLITRRYRNSYGPVPYIQCVLAELKFPSIETLSSLTSSLNGLYV